MKWKQENIYGSDEALQLVSRFLIFHFSFHFLSHIFVDLILDMICLCTHNMEFENYVIPRTIVGDAQFLHGLECMIKLE